MIKKWLSLLLIVTMLILAACSNKEKTHNDATDSATDALNTESEFTKEALLQKAQAITKDELSKSIDNLAFAKSLINNTYTFNGIVYKIQENYAVITFAVDYTDEVYGETVYQTVENVMVGNVYLSSDELIAMENEQKFSFVGELGDVKTTEQNFFDETYTVVEFLFEHAAIVSDQFQKSGKLDSPNGSYGNNSWNVKYPDSDYLGLVYFAEDVSNYQGKEITFTCKIINGQCVDAHIVE